MMTIWPLTSVNVLADDAVQKSIDDTLDIDELRNFVRNKILQLIERLHAYANICKLI